MALTPAVSAEYALQVGPPAARVSTPDWGGRLEVSKGSLTFTAAGQGTAQMIRLPAGRLIIFPDLCRLVVPAGVAGALVQVGLGSYVDMTGATIAAAPSALALDVANTAAIDAVLPLPAVGYLVIESKAGVDVTLAVGTQNSAAAGEAEITLVYGRSK